MDLEFFSLTFYLVPENSLNVNKNCWHECAKKKGPCDFCGSGLCCKKGEKEKGCGGFIGGENSYICVPKGNKVAK